MKKIKSLSLLLVLIVVVGTGCLKDKGFDNHEYGINSPTTSPSGVGFNLGIKYKNAVGLDLGSTPQTIENIVVVSLFSGQPAPADVNVKIQLDPTIVANYNTANGTDIQDLDPALFDIGSPDLVIRKGEKLAKVVISVPTTVSLDPNLAYGIGFRIVSADAGYTIATNEDELLIQIGLKNKYDGVYNLRGFHNRVPYTFPYDVEEYMITAGASSVAFFWPEKDDFGHPIGVAPGVTNWYGNGVAPVVVFDLATNLVTDVFNSTGAPPITMFTGAGAGVSRYEPATKTIYVWWNYNNNPLRLFTDTLVYTGPRP